MFVSMKQRFTTLTFPAVVFMNTFFHYSNSCPTKKNTIERKLAHFRYTCECASLKLNVHCDPTWLLISAVVLSRDRQLVILCLLEDDANPAFIESPVQMT